MTDMNPTPSGRPDKDQEPKNHFFETAKQKTVEFIRIATPIVQAGLKTAIRGIRHGIAVGRERFLQLDRRQQLIAVAVAGFVCLFIVVGFFSRSGHEVSAQVPATNGPTAAVVEEAKSETASAEPKDEVQTDKQQPKPEQPATYLLAQGTTPNKPNSSSEPVKEDDSVKDNVLSEIQKHGFSEEKDFLNYVKYGDPKTMKALQGDQFDRAEVDQAALKKHKEEV